MKKSTERLKSITSQLNNLNLDFTRFDAIVGKNLSKKTLNDKCTFFCRYFYTYGMIGCFLSHQKIWENIIEKDEKVVMVLEDDCILDLNFKIHLKDTLDELYTIDPDWDILYTGSFGAAEYSGKYDLMGHIVKFILPNIKNEKNIKGKHVYIPEAPLGTHCYIVSNKGARKLRKYLDKVDYHVDASILNFSKYLKIYASKNKLGKQASSADNSTLTQNFPNVFNKIIDYCNIKDMNDIMYSYHLSIPIIQIIYPINIYLILFSIIIFFIPQSFYFFMCILFFEFILCYSNFDIILFWGLIFSSIFRIRNDI